MKDNCVTIGQNLFNLLVFEAHFSSFLKEQIDFKN